MLLGNILIKISVFLIDTSIWSAVLRRQDAADSEYSADVQELIDEGRTGFLAAAPTVELLDAALEAAWQRRERWEEMGSALERYLPQSSQMPTFGGSSFWVRGPEGLDADRLAEKALQEGIIVEPGRVFFAGDSAPANYFRLGFSSIESQEIAPGIELLATLIGDHRTEKGRTRTSRK